MEWVSGGLGMMWGPSRRCGDDGDDTGTMWGRWGQHGVETTETTEETTETTAMGTTWGPSGGYRDNVGMTGTTRG